MFQIIYPFLISLMIGLLIGIERERNIKKRYWVGGIRTFILFALLGTSTAKIDKIYLTIVISAFIFSLLILSYFRASQQEATAKKGVGITTELAAALVFILGYMAYCEPRLAIALSIIVLVVLFERESLHKFSREKLTSKEIKAGLIILVIALAILPLLPTEPIDPWHLINLQKIFILIAVLAGMQFGGYIALRIFGVRLGYLLVGFLGGLVSSTALYATLTKNSKHKNADIVSLLAAGLAGISSTLVEVFVIVVIVAPKLAKTTIMPIGAMILASGLIALTLTKKSNKGKVNFVELPNPLDLKSVLKLALVIFSMYIIVAMTRQFIGLKATGIVTFLGGLFESHSVILANAMLYSKQKLLLNEAANLVYLAVLSAFISKFGLVIVLGRNRFASIVSLLLIMVLAIGGGCYFLIMWGQ